MLVKFSIVLVLLASTCNHAISFLSIHVYKCIFEYDTSERVYNLLQFGKAIFSVYVHWNYYILISVQVGNGLKL